MSPLLWLILRRVQKFVSIVFFYLMTSHDFHKLSNINKTKLHFSKLSISWLAIMLIPSSPHRLYKVPHFYLISSQLFIDTTNLIILNKKIKFSSERNPNTTPTLIKVRKFILSLCRFKNASSKRHDHCLTGIKIAYNTFSQSYYIPFLVKKSYPFSYLTVVNVKETNTSKWKTKLLRFNHIPSIFFYYRISMDTKSPIIPLSHKTILYPCQFSHFDNTVTIKSNKAKTSVKTF